VGRAVVRAVAGVAVVITVTLVGLVVLLLLSATRNVDNGQQQGTSLCTSEVVNLGQVRNLDAAQLANSAKIIEVGRGMQVPERGIEVALATAMQESTLRNLNYGDRDSVGLFQQRPSSGWGSVAELTTPEISARKFYDALLKVNGWQTMSLTEAAQRVQRSAFPFAYAKWEALASAILGAAGSSRAPSLECATSIGVSAPSGAVGDMLRIALAQQGKPYVWGATGPDSFDCSGLIVYAWRLAGYRLTIRTSEQMWRASDPVARGTEQPGDLLFTHFGSGGPGHVMIVVRKGLAVQAPRTGDVVKVIPYRAQDWTIGRLRAEAMRPIQQGA
jgi:peptidoglycan DL-endopeptidase CwlO